MAARGSPQMIEEEWERAGESHSSSGGAKESVAFRSVHLPRPPFSQRPQAVLGAKFCEDREGEVRRSLTGRSSANRPWPSCRRMFGKREVIRD